MKEIRGKLIERIKRTDAVESFRFLPSERIDFFPGQFLQVIFDEDNKGNKDLNKYLSFSCAPKKEYIEITKKISNSEFSKRLSKLNEGDEVLFKAPFGNCIFKNEYKKIGFLVGGIGVTPVISILEYIAYNKIDIDVYLLYSNWTEKDIAFKKELEDLSEKNRNIKIAHILVTCDIEDKRCFKGVIDKGLLERQGIDLLDRVIFVFGPPAMVGAMKDICLKAGVSKERLLTESFIGY